MSNSKHNRGAGRRTKCAATGKVLYRTPRDAKIALRAIAVQRYRALTAGLTSTRNELRYYYCDEDGAAHYHLTSQPAVIDVHLAVLAGIDRVASSMGRVA